MRRTRKQDGYALLLAVFFATLLLLAVLTAAPNVRNERQREKEEEMIWRGKQYVHAIKLYYRKNGRFPTSIEDLTKPKNGSLRYLRQEYKDPMNKVDGSWRLIYVGPGGQLIGSLKPPQTLQLAGAGSQIGTPAAQAGFGFGFGPSQGTSAPQAPQSASGAQGTDTTSATPGAPGAPGTPSSPQDPNSANAGAGTGTGTGIGTGNNPSGTGFSPMSSPVGLSPMSSSDSDSPTIIGGNIIGVGSKVNKKSIIIYEKGDNYRLFEFVWDPSKDVMTVGGQPGMQVGTPNAPGQGFGTSGFGQAPGTFGGTFGTQPSSQPSNNPNTPGNNPSPVPPLTPNSPMP